MGLDVSFYAAAEMVHGEKHPRALTEPQPGPSEECWDAFTVAYVNPDFPDQADGIIHRSCWETDRRAAHIHHSYGGYNRYRELLCQAALGVLPEVVWTDPDAYRDRPFFEQIHFADNEGTLGPVTSAKLAKNYVEQRGRVLAQADEIIHRYDEWLDAFALIGPTGFVRFA